MGKADKTKVPVLEEVIVQGNQLSESVDKTLNLLDEDQATLLSQQIEEIIQERLQAVLKQAVEEIKIHLDSVLPLLIDQVLNPNDELNLDDDMEDDDMELATKPVNNEKS